MSAAITPELALRPMRTLLVDDEPLARERMRLLLSAHDDVEILGECRDGAQAVRAIGELEPDVVFLDVEMPALDGFGVLQQLEGRLPTVVFVSGHDTYAARAFETHAIDYLLKPVAAERVDRSLARIRVRRAEALLTGLPTEPDLRALLAHLRREPQASVPTTGPARLAPDTRRIAVKHEGQLLLMERDEIAWVEASGNYVVLHARGGRYPMRETMKHMETLLDPGQFVRIHRGAIVNVAQIRALEPWMHGECVVVLHDGTRLMASRVYVGRLRRLIRR